VLPAAGVIASSLAVDVLGKLQETRISHDVHSDCGALRLGTELAIKPSVHFLILLT